MKPCENYFISLWNIVSLYDLISRTGSSVQIKARLYELIFKFQSVIVDVTMLSVVDPLGWFRNIKYSFKKLSRLSLN